MQKMRLRSSQSAAGIRNFTSCARARLFFKSTLTMLGDQRKCGRVSQRPSEHSRKILGRHVASRSGMQRAFFDFTFINSPELLDVRRGEHLRVVVDSWTSEAAIRAKDDPDKRLTREC